MSSDIQPNNTIYIRNLNEKIRKDGNNYSDKKYVLIY